MLFRRRAALLPLLLLTAAGVLAWALFGMGSAARAQSGFELRDGDRVLFYGDSITDHGPYTTFVEDYVVTRFPRWNIRFLNAGWTGDRVSGGAGGPIDARLERDVVPFQPTVMTIMLGMNDGGYHRYNTGLFVTYAQGYESLVRKLRHKLPGTRLTLVQPSPYDDVTRPPSVAGGYNTVLARYGRFVRELAAQQGVTAADLNAPVTAALRRAESVDPEGARQIIPDRIHPAPAGHLLLAAALLKAWNAPRLVTAVTLDATRPRVIRQENTRVWQLQGGERLSWTQWDDALPLPLDRSDPVLPLASSGIVESLDQQPLRVTGLSAPRYTLTIDGEAVGSFWREELARGVNLALLPTPMGRQAAEVHELTLRRNEIHFVRWRQVQVPLQAHRLRALPPALRALDALEDELIRQQHAAAHPRPHRYELAPEA